MGKAPPILKKSMGGKIYNICMGRVTLKRANHPPDPQLEHSNKKCPGQKIINTVQINDVPSSQKLH